MNYPIIYKVFLSQVVQDFFHQQYHWGGNKILCKFTVLWRSFGTRFLREDTAPLVQMPSLEKSSNILHCRPNVLIFV